ncbi:MAG TPA: RlpA-like double-psi beta-barrel domain-containing protein [Gaiellaceae bacterium]|nr:RlpA-like double-psi beta-barrel domain-containing protein [Gaiellaceae bacterium]
MTITVRALALAVLAVLAVLAAVAYMVWPSHHSSTSTGGPWYTALASAFAPSSGTRTSACGVKIGPDTVGVAHPRLPCGVRIVVEYHGTDVATRVIDRGAVVPGHDFDLTQALARRLGLQGTQTIHWRFAR